MENPIKIDDLGVPLFSETSIYYFKSVPGLASILFIFRQQLARFLSGHSHGPLTTASESQTEWLSEMISKLRN